MRKLALLILVIVCLPARGEDGERRPMVAENLWRAKRLGAPALSPDGKWAAVEVSEYKLDDNSSTSDLWLIATDGKSRKQLTRFQGKDSGPAWSPDGKTIAFVSKRSGDVPQIHLIAPDGGEARQLSRLPMAPTGLKWSPDGKTLYCVVDTWLDTPDDDSYQKRAKDRKDSKVQALVIDDAMYRYWDHWIADGKRPVVFAVDAATGKHKNLFAGLKLHLPVFGAGAESYDISPDGKELCFTADTVKEIGTDFNLDLYTMPLDKPGEPKNITADNPADDDGPVYAPDGKKIAFSRQTIRNFYADRVRLMVLDRAGGKLTEVTKDFDRSCDHPLWSPDAAHLLFAAENAGYHQLFSVPIEGGSVRALTQGHSDVSPSLSKDGTLAVFLRNNFDHPARLFAIEGDFFKASLDMPKPRRLDAFNDELTASWKIGAVKNVTYKGAGGADVQMWIVYPPDFDAKKNWPLLMVVHGGPHNGITTSFHYRWNAHLQASKGYVLAIPNFHGSSGFGQKFCDSITGDMATLPFEDVMKATDYMEKQPYIDKKRMAAAGASYGGFMMSWLNGHTDRFKAMVCHAGVYNWDSMMASDVVVGRERRLGAFPWDNHAQVDKQSPHRFAANFKTPTLVFHGEKDYRVPVSQGFEYYNTLRLKRVPTRLVYFPDENHWVMKPQNSILWHREFFAWLDRYIGHGPTK